MKKRGLGAAFGAGAVFRGIGFIAARPSLWGYAMVPIVVCAVLATALGGLGIWATGAMLEGRGSGEGLEAVGLVVARVVLGLVAVLVAFVVAAALAQPLSGPALDALSRRQEKELGGEPREGPPFFAGLAASLKVTLFGLMVGLPALFSLAALGFFVPPLVVVTVPLKLVVVGLLAAWDFLDYPLSLRGMRTRARVAFFVDHFGAVLGFGLAAAILLLVPGLGLVLLPAGVVGGTRLVLAAERGEVS